MKTYGIIAEYNPFHLGHLYQINKIKEMDKDSRIIVLVSSCFTQRGDLSIVDKWNRTELLLNNNIDLVIEFPFYYASQGADIFAKGAIEILGKLKIDYLVFGIDSIEVDTLKDMAKLQLESKEYNDSVKELMDKGVSYPTAMSSAIYKYMSLKIDKPNDLLGLSYVKEIIRQNMPIEPLGIKRTNDYHDVNSDMDIISGSAIRELIKQGKDVNKYIVGNVKFNKICQNDYYNLLKYQIINNINCLDKFNTVDEGIDNRIKKVIFNANNWDELVLGIKTKRYTYNKINRMLIHILTNFTKEENNSIELDYIRLLGFTTNGQRYLNEIKKSIDVPVVTRYKKNISLMFDLEFRIHSIYCSVLENGNDLVDKEYKQGPIIKKM